MATITGTAKAPNGAAITSGRIVFEPLPRVVAASGADTIFPNAVTAEIGAAGAMSFTLQAGEYRATYNESVIFNFTVPSGATADFNDCLPSNS